MTAEIEKREHRLSFGEDGKGMDINEFYIEVQKGWIEAGENSSTNTPLTPRLPQIVPPDGLLLREPIHPLNSKKL